MSNKLRRIRRLAALFGFDPSKCFQSSAGLLKYRKDLKQLKKSLQKCDLKDEFTFGKFIPCLYDHRESSGVASGHYFHQDLYVAQRIFLEKPEKHVDVGSRVDGFVSHLAVFRKVQVLDIRSLDSTVENIEFLQLDLMKKLPKKFLEFTDSLSCLHTLEHFGLGRYGDSVDASGHLKGLDNLAEIVAKDGTLYLSVPIGPQRIEFNAHRVFSVDYIIRITKSRFDLKNFSFVDDSGNLHKDVGVRQNEVLENYGCYHGCGIFELRKNR